MPDLEISRRPWRQGSGRWGLALLAALIYPGMAGPAVATPPRAAPPTSGPEMTTEWPQYRGDGTGISTETGLPLTWSEQENVAFKIAVKGRGHSSPVVKNGKVWLTTAMEDERSLRLLAFDARSGKSLHDIELFRPSEWQDSHPDNSFASPTPAVDERRVCAHFGTYGTACVDTDDGKALWKGRPFVQQHEVGPGGSPILFDDLLIVSCDGTDSQYIAALQAESGELAWRTPRRTPEARKPPHRKAFSTPLIFRYGPRWQLLSTGASHTSAYDPLTGEELWWIFHEGYSNVAMPLVGLGFAFVDTGYMRPHLLAVALGGEGDVTSSHIRWSYYWQVPANPSPLLVGRRIFFVNDHGNATLLDAFLGEEIWRRRLGGKHYASPLLAEGRIYIFGLDGRSRVIAARDEFEVLAVNTLDGAIFATPAIADGALFIRTEGHLYRIELPGPAGPSVTNAADTNAADTNAADTNATE